MTDTPLPPAPMARWLSEPLPPEVESALDRLARVPGVARIAVMPDAHLATQVCVGTVVATETLLIPHAVGGDIGCGMCALAFDASADALREPFVAERLLTGLYRVTPIIRQSRDRVLDLPPALDPAALSHAALGAVARRDGRVQLGTLGRGNHFLEFQADDEGRLWLMVHSGSRGIGQAITDHHLQLSTQLAAGLRGLDATTDAGQAYLADVQWAIAYARENRRCMTEAAVALARQVIGAAPVAATFFDADHNHIRAETHDGRPLLVHRKGANAAHAGQPGIIPGSMGSFSYHVEGRGEPRALCSSSHGAGRAMDRTQARRTFSTRDLHRQLKGIWYDPRSADGLRDEAPAAYKDIQAVMRAQSELVRIVRRLQPVLCFKGG